jgi:hypothetical protein
MTNAFNLTSSLLDVLKYEATELWAPIMTFAPSTSIPLKFSNFKLCLHHRFQFL